MKKGNLGSTKLETRDKKEQQEMQQKLKEMSKRPELSQKALSELEKKVQSYNDKKFKVNQMIEKDMLELGKLQKDIDGYKDSPRHWHARTRPGARHGSTCFSQQGVQLGAYGADSGIHLRS